MSTRDSLDQVAASIPCALFNLRRATRAVTQLYDDVLKPSGLKGTQYSMLRVVHGLEPVLVTELGEAMGMDRTTVTRNLRLLERKKLLVVEPGEDRRTRVVRLTGAGKRSLDRAHRYWEQAQHAVVSGVGDARFERLRAQLASVVEVSQAARGTS